MYLIEHHHSIGQPPEPHEVMFDIQHREERLIDGAHSIGSDQRSLATGEPAGGFYPLTLLAILTPHILERGHHLLTGGATVDQLQIRRRSVSKSIHKLASTGKQGIAGGLCWQGQIEATMAIGTLQVQVCHKGELSLALPHGCLHQQQSRSLALL